MFLSPEACNGVVSLGTDCNARIDMVRWRWCVVQCFGTCLMWWAQFFFIFFIFYFLFQFEEMRWLEYSQRLARFRRGVYTSVDVDNRHGGDVASLLMENATIHGASHLGVHTGKIEQGHWADFALLNLNASALRGVQDEHMMGAMILGGSGEGLVVDTCMAGKWTQRVAC